MSAFNGKVALLLFACFLSLGSSAAQKQALGNALGRQAQTQRNIAAIHQQGAQELIAPKQYCSESFSYPKFSVCAPHNWDCDRLRKQAEANGTMMHFCKKR